LKPETEELETKSKIKIFRDLYRGISDFKKGYEPRTIIAKDEKGDMVENSHSNLTSWRKYLTQLLNVHEVNDVSQTEI
jgi:hypothetical protein